ncbi:hypothetical protein AKJ16_DCAP09482 [Drosera capensis]
MATHGYHHPRLKSHQVQPHVFMHGNSSYTILVSWKTGRRELFLPIFLCCNRGKVRGPSSLLQIAKWLFTRQFKIRLEPPLTNTKLNPCYI